MKNKRKPEFNQIVSGIAVLYFIIMCFFVIKIHMDVRQKPQYEKEVYEVQPGDTLWDIGEENTSDTEDVRRWIAEVKAVNGMEESGIQAGDKIVILIER